MIKKYKNLLSRSNHRRCSIKKGILENFGDFTGKNLCWSLFLIKLQAFRPKRDSKISEIFKNTYVEEYLRTTASDLRNLYQINANPTHTFEEYTNCLVPHYC